jgi:hypothetical protein
VVLLYVFQSAQHHYPHVCLIAREIIPPPSQNTVAVCKQITLLVLYYVSSRLVTLLKVIDSSIQFSDILTCFINIFEILMSLLN